MYTMYGNGYRTESSSLLFFFFFSFLSFFSFDDDPSLFTYRTSTQAHHAHVTPNLQQSRPPPSVASVNRLGR